MAETLRLALNKTIIAGLEAPDSGRLTVWDSKCAGLQVVVTSKGLKSFYLYKWMNGRPNRIKLGDFPLMTLEQARNDVQRIVGDAARGNDPAAERRAVKRETTLGELWAWYLENHSKPHKRTWERDESRYNRYLLSWRNRRLSTITPAEVQALHAKTGADRGPYAANQLVELIRHMFAMAGKFLAYKGANPAEDVQRFEETERERFMDANELPRFFEALQTLRPASRDFFLLALFTGARRSNVLEMQWDEVSLQAGTWTVPRGKSKSKRQMTIHLSPEALAVLTERHAARSEDCPWVFPGQGPFGHYSEPKDAWKRLLQRAGLKDLRIHDLRRTLGSWQAAGGASLLVIGKSLGHSTPAATAVYARMNLDPVRQSVNSATAAMVAAGMPPAQK